MEKHLILVQKLGRCANGFEKDHGRIIHGLVTEYPNDSIQQGIALCGTLPGKRSVGWGQPFQKQTKSINCEKCKKRIEEPTPNNN